MIDMAKEEPEEGLEASNIPQYPYGLCICLTGDELEKLGLDTTCEIGDLVHLMAMARVTSVTKRQMADGGSDDRVELQIIELGAEDENAEASMAKANIKDLIGKLYK